MTCSCTRTEVIEKEPSIYDDYSVYESQYGYAGKQGPYSESDLGSDYGDGSQNGERGRASEAGTLASRSLNRNSKAISLKTACPLTTIFDQVLAKTSNHSSTSLRSSCLQLQPRQLRLIPL